MVNDACFRPPIIIRSHDLHASDMKGYGWDSFLPWEGLAFSLFFSSYGLFIFWPSLFVSHVMVLAIIPLLYIFIIHTIYFWQCGHAYLHINRSYMTYNIVFHDLLWKTNSKVRSLQCVYMIMFFNVLWICVVWFGLNRMRIHNNTFWVLWLAFTTLHTS